MFFAGQIEDFRIVIRDAELTGDEFADIAAAAAVFTGNRNDQGAFCIFLDPSRMVFAAFDFADSMVAEEQVFNRPCMVQPRRIRAKPTTALTVIGSDKMMADKIKAMIGLMKKAKDALDGPVSSMAFMKHR